MQTRSKNVITDSAKANRTSVYRAREGCIVGSISAVSADYADLDPWYRCEAMKSGKITAAGLFVFVAVAGLFAQQSALNPDQLRQWLGYISSDDLEGRSTFSEGLGLAAAYIADQLKDGGVRPGGDHGSYFQRVPVLGVRAVNRSSVTVEVNGVTRTFQTGNGVTFRANVGGKQTLTLKDVIFVGSGLNLDE